MSEIQINKRLEPAVKVSSDQSRIINSPLPRLDPNVDPRLPPPPSIREGDRVSAGQPLRTAPPNVTFKQPPMEIDMRGGGPVIAKRAQPPINTQNGGAVDLRDPNRPMQHQTQHSITQAARMAGRQAEPAITSELSIDQATLCACLVEEHIAAQTAAGASPASLVLAKSTLAALGKITPSSAAHGDDVTANIEIDIAPSSATGTK